MVYLSADDILQHLKKNREKAFIGTKSYFTGKWQLKQLPKQYDSLKQELPPVISKYSGSWRVLLSIIDEMKREKKVSNDNILQSPEKQALLFRRFSNRLTKNEGWLRSSLPAHPLVNPAKLMRKLIKEKNHIFEEFVKKELKKQLNANKTIDPANVAQVKELKDKIIAEYRYMFDLDWLLSIFNVTYHKAQHYQDQYRMENTMFALMILGILATLVYKRKTVWRWARSQFRKAFRKWKGLKKDPDVHEALQEIEMNYSGVPSLGSPMKKDNSPLIPQKKRKHRKRR